MLRILRLAFDHFWGRPRRDQRMKTGNRAAGDRDTNKRKHRPGKDWSRTIDEAGNRRHEKRWSQNNDCNRQCRDGAQFQKCAEIISRREQHPNRQDGRSQAVEHQRPCEPFLILPKPILKRGIVDQELSAPNCEGESGQSERGDPTDIYFSRAQAQPHDERHRNRRRDREHSPRAFRQRLHHNEREHGHENDHDREHTDEGEHPDACADFFLHHLPKRLATPTHGAEKDNHVVHAATECRAD